MKNFAEKGGIDFTKDNIYDAIGRPDLKPVEMTVCEYDGDPRQWACIREEQCDNCFMIDHQKECDWCTMYDHDTRKLEVKSESVTTHYEVVWTDGKPMTKVSDNILLK